MTDEELKAIEARAVRLPDIHHATDVGALCVEIRRLKGLIAEKQYGVIDGDPISPGSCPWRGEYPRVAGKEFHGGPHGDWCPAFHPDGSAR